LPPGDNPLAVNKLLLLLLLKEGIKKDRMGFRSNEKSKKNAT
jgi:hypothetical protein